MKIVIVSPGSDGLWRVNLTDGAAVTNRRRYGSAWRALAEVARHLDAGHVPAFTSAFNELVEAACDRSGAEDAA